MPDIEDDFELPENLGPCGIHGRANCLECYDLDPDDLDDDGNLIVVDGQAITDSLRGARVEAQHA